jgi:hypothetical protein
MENARRQRQKNFLQDPGVRGALDRKAYLEVLSEYARKRPEGDEVSRRHLATGPINLQRTRRILATYRVGEEVKKVFSAITEDQFWMILSEPWCGDSAQCVPYLVSLAECSPLITLRFLLRDEHPDIMDRYLTDGKRSIPKLVAFSAAGVELFRWGPRPAEAQELFLRALKEGIPREERLKQLHLWYGGNRGKAIEEEILALLRGVLA